MSSQIELINAHKTSISASNAYRIMTKLDQDDLPSGAINFVSNMFNITDDDFSERYVSHAMQWGIDNELVAIAELEKLFSVSIENTGENQERLFAGSDYCNFVSALPDGIMMLGELICTVEIKCMNPENYNFALDFILNSENLKQYDYKKYCQVQTQNLCAETHFSQPVKSIIAFYDPRHETPLHYVEVDADNNWREKFAERVMLAKQFYDKIAAENTNQPILNDAPLPPAKLANTSYDMAITDDMIDSLLANPQGFVDKACEFFNVRVVNGHFVGGNLHFDCSTKKGRDEAIKFRTKVKKVRTTAVKISKELTAAYEKKVKQEQSFRKHIESEMKLLEGYLCQSINEWEAEQKRIEQEAIEAKRIEILPVGTGGLQEKVNDDYMAEITAEQAIALVKALIASGVKKSQSWRDAISKLNKESADGVGGDLIAAVLCEKIQ